MKILRAEQMRWLDEKTIEDQHINSADLMERASMSFCDAFQSIFKDKTIPVFIFCGSGNNGGDGLAAGRMLHTRGYDIGVYLCGSGRHRSSDNKLNLERLPYPEKLLRGEISDESQIPDMPETCVVVDALFGTGLSRPVEGVYAAVIRSLNDSDVTRVAIDLPSGLYTDAMFEGVVFDAHYTITLGSVKRCFYHPESAAKCGKIVVRDIGLSRRRLEEIETDYFLSQRGDISNLIRRRSQFGHKGHFGHALLVCGSHGSMGAALLASKACLRSGCGLLTLHVPRCGYLIAQTSLPEAMVTVDRNERYISQIPEHTKYDGIGLGCGLGQNGKTGVAIKELLETAEKPLIIDADGLNIISKHGWQSYIPGDSIITPHPKEFERLFGTTSDSFERLALAKDRAVELGIVILLKGHYTAICTPEGRVYYNDSGNPGMATAGSGDVLTGILTALCVQGYPPTIAARIGAYMHGYAGDFAVLDESEESLIASDIIEHLGVAFRNIKQSQ